MRSIIEELYSYRRSHIKLKMFRRFVFVVQLSNGVIADVVSQGAMTSSHALNTRVVRRHAEIPKGADPDDKRNIIVIASLVHDDYSSSFSG